jgi:hypothetical protein
MPIRTKRSILKVSRHIEMGHDQLVKIHLLEKTAQHDFAFTRQHLSKQLI